MPVHIVRTGLLVSCRLNLGESSDLHSKQAAATTRTCSSTYRKYQQTSDPLLRPLCIDNNSSSISTGPRAGQTQAAAAVAAAAASEQTRNQTHNSPVLERQSEPRHILVVFEELGLRPVGPDQDDLESFPGRAHRIVGPHKLRGEASARAAPEGVWGCARSSTRARRLMSSRKTSTR